MATKTDFYRRTADKNNDFEENNLISTIWMDAGRRNRNKSQAKTQNTALLDIM